MRIPKTLIRLGGCPGWSESSLGAQSHCWLFHEAAQVINSHGPHRSLRMCWILNVAGLSVILTVHIPWICRTFYFMLWFGHFTARSWMGFSQNSVHTIAQPNQPWLLVRNSFIKGMQRNQWLFCDWWWKIIGTGKEVIRFWWPWPDFQVHHTIKTVKMSLVCTPSPESNCQILTKPLRHGKEMTRFWWPWPHFQGHTSFECQILTKKACLHPISWTKWWILAKLYVLCHWDN